MGLCVQACVCVCVRACVRACVRVRARAHIYFFNSPSLYLQVDKGGGGWICVQVGGRAEYGCGEGDICLAHTTG